MRLDILKGTGLIGGLTRPPDKKKKSGGVGDTLKSMFGFH